MANIQINYESEVITLDQNSTTYTVFISSILYTRDLKRKTQIVNFIMNTIFSDNKIQEASISQLVSFKNIPVAPHLPLRHSLSPQKKRTSKKFFFPVRNQSSRTEDSPSKNQLEGVLRREKMMLMAQKMKFNELILTPDLLIGQNQLLSFPSLEVKPKPPVTRKLKEKPPLPQIRLEQAHSRQHYSNILGNGSTISPQVKWKSQRKIESPEPLRKSTIVPSVRLKEPLPDVFGPKTERRSNPEGPESNASSPLTRFCSQKQIESVECPKKYKKGYLAYQNGGIELWQKVKSNWTEPDKVSIDRRIVTAKNFIVFNLNQLNTISSHGAEKQIEIASLSKIMTCYLTLLIAKKYEVDLKTINYRVPDSIAGFPGTSAELIAGDIISGWDLLFALMLPSGNDASLCLAELMGKVIQRHRKKEQRRSYLETFLAHMNLFSKELELKQEWGNSHGLPANPNISTPRSIVSLTALALTDPTFRLVINTKEHEVLIKNDRYGLSSKKCWKNTNKLLDKGWEGVKTGTTDSAGPCLMALKDKVLIGVFECQALSKRFSDSVKLYDTLASHLQTS